jgi:inosine-uridine nucleoside N-ribohydrolase
MVSVGGLSNNALFLQQYPELRTKIARFVIMGGCVRPFELEGKSMPPRLETNLHHDIKASEIVLNSGIPITLVPVEVTVHAKLYYPDFDRIQASPSPLAQAITAHTRDWSARMKAIMKTFGVEAFLSDTVVWLHDPLAVCVLVDPRVAKVERQRIRVETSPGDIRTIADPKGPLTIDLVTAVDSTRLSRLVTESVLQK